MSQIKLMAIGEANELTYWDLGGNTSYLIDSFTSQIAMLLAYNHSTMSDSCW